MVQTKAVTLKQELSLYISTFTSSKDFQTYWNEQNARLPILLSCARQYGCAPKALAPSESAFSVAGYIDRK